MTLNKTLFRNEIEPLCSLSDAIHGRTNRTCLDSTVIEGSQSYPVVTSSQQFWAGSTLPTPSSLFFSVLFLSISFPHILTSSLFHFLSMSLSHSLPVPLHHFLIFILKLYLTPSLLLHLSTLIPLYLSTSLPNSHFSFNSCRTFPAFTEYLTYKILDIHS